MDVGTEAQKYVWKGAIPLQIHLHESEVTALPAPPPALILAPRIGYLPLLVSHIKPHFSSALPPGEDTIWFDYKGLPLKWYVPTGVLFDLLCAEPERPWNLTVHFRGYPGNILTPCEGEDSVKWSFINSLKEAAYITNGNSKIVMNMSQSDQMELWNSVLHGNIEAYLRVSSKLKLGMIEDDYTMNLDSCSTKSRQNTGETEIAGRIPIRLYLRSGTEDFDDVEDAPQIDTWDKISYVNRPVEYHKEEGKSLTLRDVLKIIVPEVFIDHKNQIDKDKDPRIDVEDEQKATSESVSGITSVEESTELKFVRVHGIEPKLDIPFSWVVNNLTNPDHFLHICACVKIPQPS